MSLHRQPAAATSDTSPRSTHRQSLDRYRICRCADGRLRRWQGSVPQGCLGPRAEHDLRRGRGEQRLQTSDGCVGVCHHVRSQKCVLRVGSVSTLGCRGDSWRGWNSANRHPHDGLTASRPAPHFALQMAFVYERRYCSRTAGATIESTRLVSRLPGIPLLLGSLRVNSVETATTSWRWGTTSINWPP